MNPEIEYELRSVWEDHRQEFSKQFPQYGDYIARQLIAGQWPVLRWREGESPNQEITILNASLNELHLLLCTKDKRYADVRKGGDSFVKVALPAISIYLAGICGVSAGVASGALALAALTIFRVGQGTFCRVAPTLK